MDLLDETASSAPRRSLAEYLEIPLRRPWLVALPFVLVVAASVVASMVVPEKYRSSTFILVESEKAPANVVPGLATGQRTDRRMQTIKQEILSRTRLEQVIKETSPYPTEGRTITNLVEWMRSSADISVRGPDSFDIQYVHTDPRKAAEVVNRLATLFIEETNRARAQQIEEAHTFLEAQVAEARGDLESKEETVRRYKESHMGSLPEQSMANLSTLQRLQQQAQAIGEDLRAALDRQAELEGQIAELSGGGSVPELEGSPRKEISQLQSQLDSLRTRYTDEHPDIQQLLARLEALRSSTPREPSPTAPGKSPALTTAELRREHTRREIAVLEDKRAAIERRIAGLQGRIDATPRVEQELTTITRDFGKLRENYLDLVNKKLDAQMVAKLEERWKGDSFRILDPAHVPERPFFPNRPLFVAVGIVVGLLVGLGASVAVELLDRSFKSPAEVESMLPYPLMAVLPHATPLPSSRSRR